MRLDVHQKGFGLLVFVIGFAILLLLITGYFVGFEGKDKSGNPIKSQYDSGQQGINQAKKAGEDSKQYQTEVNQQLEIQDIQNQLP